MFRPFDTSNRAKITVNIDGETVCAYEGMDVATALLLTGKEPYRRSVVGGCARSPYCMIGNCYECLVEIDGQPNQQGCLTILEPNMRIRRQLERPTPTKKGPRDV